MAFKNAQQTRASIGLLNASGYTRSLAANDTTETLDTTTLVDTARASIVGPNTGDGSFDMILDTVGTANLQYSVLTTWKSTQPTPLDIAPEGYATSNPVIMYNALQTQVTTQAQVSTTVDASVSFMAGDGIDYGVSVEDYTAITTTTTGTARDGAAATGNGGVAHLHVTAYSGLTSNTVTIEHSVDGSTSWATLVTFTAATAVTSQRVVVAPGTTVRRYLRVVDTVVVGGGGTNTRQVSFARR